MTDHTRRTFLKQAALGTAAMMAYPPSTVLGANDRVRVGMIGVGDRGNDLLGQVLPLHGVEVVAMADVYSRRRDQAKSRVPGLQTFDDHRRILDMKDIDGVIVASPLHTHARHFLDTLAAGKDLYAEKTMTWSIPEADKCLSAAKNSNRVVQIGLQYQSSGAMIDAKQMIKDGWVGKVTQVESWMGRNTPHGKGQWVRPVPADCTVQNVNWSAFLNGRPDRPFDPYKLINWRLFWEFAGGNCAENMVHQIAWIMGALDLPLPSAAYMSGGVFSEKDGREVPDTIAVTLDFPKDIVVTWQSTFSNKHYQLGDHILGSDGTLEHHFDEPLQYWPEKTNRSGDAVRGQTKEGDHMANWIDCIRSRAVPNAPAEMGYRSAIAVHMANLSTKTKSASRWKKRGRSRRSSRDSSSAAVPAVVVAASRRHPCDGETPPRQPARRRRYVLQALQEDGDSMIGAVDIGGTKIAVGIVDDLGKVLVRTQAPTDPNRYDQGVELIAQMLRKTAAQAGAELSGIGIGSTGPVDPIRGEFGDVDFLPGWRGKNPVHDLAQIFNVRVALENDGDAAALAEAGWGAGRNRSRLIYVTVGTGIGGGMVFDGKLYRGVDGAHPEVGHHVVDPAGPQCSCGFRGCWESLAAGPAMVAWLESRAPVDYPHLQGITAKKICELAQQGDAIAKQTVEHEAYYLGLGLANLINLFTPDAIVLSGSVMKSAPLFLDRIREVIRGGCRFVPAEKTQLTLASLGDDTNLIGAARVWHYRFGRETNASA